jgi:hypothetical protein
MIRWEAQGRLLLFLQSIKSIRVKTRRINFFRSFHEWETAYFVNFFKGGHAFREDHFTLNYLIHFEIVYSDFRQGYTLFDFIENPIKVVKERQ